jgi:hypothetical protein
MNVSGKIFLTMLFKNFTESQIPFVLERGKNDRRELSHWRALAQRSFGKWHLRLFVRVQSAGAEGRALDVLSRYGAFDAQVYTAPSASRHAA